MSVIPPSDSIEILKYFHGKLDVHFRQLHEKREGLKSDPPVYALEHDLAEADRELLLGSVRSVIAQGMRTQHRTCSLPFTIYAAESAYDYNGDEYWPTFEKSTPNWHTDQRPLVKEWFSKFSEEYGGAVPTGAFADNFTIIAWPITHAILPTYLQRQLAQLLFEFRNGLSSELLGDPGELGIRLAARAHRYSDRFRVFCQNTALLGQVAAALLSGEDEASPYLLKSTLDRLLDGLSLERQSQQWLTGARQAASQVRTAGFKRSNSTGAPKDKPKRLPRATDPRFFLRYLSGAWNAYAELPDMTTLSGHLPHLFDELRTLRGKVTGGSRPVPPGGLVHSGQEIRFDAWPDSSKPFVQLERGTTQVNTTLADQCVMTRGPWWLYRDQGSGLAVEVKGGFLRPGHKYILVGKDGQELPGISWFEPVPLRATGASAYQLDVPPRWTERDASLLVAHGISVRSTVTIHPVGIVASAWDGEGTAEWLAGEPVILRIHSEITPTCCLITVDREPHFIQWPQDQVELILLFAGLDVGSHEVVAKLFGLNDHELTDGSLVIAIRDPQVRPPNAATGEGIRMLASPARPTYAELWDEGTTITIDGPSGAEAQLEVSLRGSDGLELAAVSQTVRLPIGEKHWATCAELIRTKHSFKDFYDEAESCKLTVHCDGVGMASLTCERSFQPLRWRFSKNRDGRVSAILHDRTDRANTCIEFFAVDEPLTAVSHDTGTPVDLPPRGGLLRAVSEGIQAAVVAPTNPNGVITLNWRQPHVPYGDKSIAGVMRLVEAHRLWAAAELPADPFAVHQRRLILEVITRTNAILLCGSHYWAKLECELEWADELADHLEQMQETLGVSRGQRAVAAEIGRSLYCWLQPEALLSGFANVIEAMLTANSVKEQLSAADFLLTLASRPGHITEWSVSERNYLLDLVIRTPVLLRAARFAVLGTRALKGPATTDETTDESF